MSVMEEVRSLTDSQLMIILNDNSVEDEVFHAAETELYHRYEEIERHYNQ